MSVLKLIDYNKCLLLDERHNNKYEILKEWKERGININFFITGNGDMDLEYDNTNDNILPPIFHNSIPYATWYKRPNPFNAWKSMKKIWNKFLSTNGKYFLFLEDDSFIENDFDTIIEKTSDYLLINKWDILYLGGYYKNTLTDTNIVNIKKTNGCMGFHSVILTRKILEEIVQFDPLGPFDWQVANKIHKKYNCLAIYPSIVSQKSGFSNIEGHNLGKPSRYDK